MLQGEIYILDPSNYDIINVKSYTSKNKEDIMLWIIKDHFQLLYDNEVENCTWDEFYDKMNFKDPNILINYFETFNAYDSRDYVFHSYD